MRLVVGTNDNNDKDCLFGAGYYDDDDDNQNVTFQVWADSSVGLSLNKVVFSY